MICSQGPGSGGGARWRAGRRYGTVAVIAGRELTRELRDSRDALGGTQMIGLSLIQVLNAFLRLTEQWFYLLLNRIVQ